jgi:hypothetical protein
MTKQKLLQTLTVHTMDVGDFVSIYGTHPTNFTPDFYDSETI